ncbi:unnamed protein product [Prunus armeniaca]
MGERGMAWWIWAVRMSDLGGVGRSNRETAAAWENGREGHGLVDLGSAYVGFGRVSGSNRETAVAWENERERERERERKATK